MRWAGRVARMGQKRNIMTDFFMNFQFFGIFSSTRVIQFQK
jgi:hypothetical protein